MTIKNVSYIILVHRTHFRDVGRFQNVLNVFELPLLMTAQVLEKLSLRRRCSNLCSNTKSCHAFRCKHASHEIIASLNSIYLFATLTVHLCTQGCVWTSIHIEISIQRCLLHRLCSLAQMWAINAVFRSIQNDHDLYQRIKFYAFDLKSTSLLWVVGHVFSLCVEQKGIMLPTFFNVCASTMRSYFPWILFLEKSYFFLKPQKRGSIHFLKFELTQKFRLHSRTNDFKQEYIFSTLSNLRVFGDCKFRF